MVVVGMTVVVGILVSFEFASELAIVCLHGVDLFVWNSWWKMESAARAVVVLCAGCVFSRYCYV